MHILEDVFTCRKGNWGSVPHCMRCSLSNLYNFIQWSRKICDFVLLLSYSHHFLLIILGLFHADILRKTSKNGNFIVNCLGSVFFGIHFTLQLHITYQENVKSLSLKLSGMYPTSTLMFTCLPSLHTTSLGGHFNCYTHGTRDPYLGRLHYDDTL